MLLASLPQIFRSKTVFFLGLYAAHWFNSNEYWRLPAKAIHNDTIYSAECILFPGDNRTHEVTFFISSTFAFVSADMITACACVVYPNS